MATKVEALAAVTIAVQKAIEAQEIREDFLEGVKAAFATDTAELQRKIRDDQTTGPELIAIVALEAGIELSDVLETVSDVWAESEKQQREGPTEEEVAG